MRRKRPKANEPILYIAVFSVGLFVAGGLLYRWISRASVADHEQQVEFLNAATRSFRGEFIAPLLEIRATFRPVPRRVTSAALDKYLKGFYTQWKSNDVNGPLVSTFGVATIDTNGKVRYRTLDPQSGKFKQSPMPQSLGTFRPIIERVNNRNSGHILLYRASGFPFTVEGNRPVVVVPLLEFGGEPRGFGFWGQARGSGGLRPPPTIFSEREIRPHPPQRAGRQSLPDVAARAPFPGRLRGWCFLGLDLDYFKHHLLPQLVERSFSKAGLANYQVAVLSGDPPEVIFSSQPGLTPSSFASPDEEAVLFNSLRGPGRGFRTRAREFFLHLPPADERSDSTFATMRVIPREADTQGHDVVNHFPKPNTWVLVAKNKAGSINALVARTRRRNLALGFGVLFLLAFSMGSLVVTTHRARELAKREVEFVAGVSHEFRTPLASIQSAGFNLASGVIRKSSRVQEYGRLVQNEARRLTDMIEQVMSYAGIQSRGKQYELVPAEISRIIDRALGEYRMTLTDAGWEVKKEVTENLPPVLADSSALESAVKNLIANAIKYGGAGKWLRVTAKAAPESTPTEVQISVEDHGPGIDPADLPHIFEPFYRGQRVLGSTVPGAGLGLSIVKRHLEGQGGRVSVENTDGRGSRFTLHLPASSEQRSVAI